tara:strand:- start:1813 stop:2964 length:1152 start_codon:yes stop_codon:yes gene_type:complete
MSSFNNLVFAFLLAVILQSCGKAYFPLEIKTKSRSERLRGQEQRALILEPLNEKSISTANKSKYLRRVIDADDLGSPAKIISVQSAIKEKLPASNDPGPYIVGVGDEFVFAQIIDTSSEKNNFVSRSIGVSDDGYINLIDAGRINAIGKTQSEIEAKIYDRLSNLGSSYKFELQLTGFRSKRIFVNGDGFQPQTIPYTNIPIYLEDVLSKATMQRNVTHDARVSILRGSEKYEVSLLKIIKGNRNKIRLFPDDKIFISPLTYRPEKVLVVGETFAQTAIPITSFQRQTLSETLFNGRVLNNVTSDFSQIYVIRENNKKLVAYHLDITNPGRISLANKFEMRPDDVVFVATQPLSLYSRAVSQILGSTGLTLQARDTIRTEIGN